MISSICWISHKSRLCSAASDSSLSRIIALIVSRFALNARNCADAAAAKAVSSWATRKINVCWWNRRPRKKFKVFALIAISAKFKRISIASSATSASPSACSPSRSYSLPLYSPPSTLSSIKANWRNLSINLWPLKCLTTPPLALKLLWTLSSPSSPPLYYRRVTAQWPRRSISPWNSKAPSRIKYSIIRIRW